MIPARLLLACLGLTPGAAAAVPLTVAIFNAAGEVVRTFPAENKPIAVTDVVLSYTAAGSCASWTSDPAQPFSPDGDCANDLLRIGFPELTDTTTGATHDHLWWDGTTGAGAWASNGTYLVRAETSHTATGAPIAIIRSVTLSALHDAVDARIYGASGLQIRRLAGFTLPGIANLRVDPNPYAPEVTGTNLVLFRLLDAAGNQIGLLDWNGRSESGVIVENGTYTLSLRSIGPGGNVTDITTSFTVLHDDLLLVTDVRPVPNPATADGGVIWFSYRPVAAGLLTSVQLTVWTVGGDRLYSRDLTRQSAPADPLDANGDGKGSVSWNLKNEANRQAGSGLYVAGLEFTGGGTTQRAIVKIGIR